LVEQTSIEEEKASENNSEDPKSQTVGITPANLAPPWPEPLR
jgi:hypothetical protein